MSIGQTMLSFSPVTLTGTYVTLRPMQSEDAPALWAAHSPGLTRWFPYPLERQDQLEAWIASALADARAGTVLPWVTIDRRTDRIIGSTRFANAAFVDRRLEIGWTFVAVSHQGGPFNAEAKLLQLAHAFETLGARRVELKTDGLNTRSRAAIAAIGAIEEGVLRAHTATESGRQRDTVYFSILSEEWPAVRQKLTERVALRGAGIKP